MNLNHNHNRAAAILRIGLGLVFLWFGVFQLVNPSSFLGYVPSFLYDHGKQVSHEHPFQFIHDIPHPGAHFVIMFNGAFELIAALLLLGGLYTRIAASLLAIHLFFIITSLGYNDIAVRDFGLMISTIAIALHGPDKYCLDQRLRKG